MSNLSFFSKNVVEIGQYNSFLWVSSKLLSFIKMKMFASLKNVDKSPHSAIPIWNENLPYILI